SEPRSHLASSYPTSLPCRGPRRGPEADRFQTTCFTCRPQLSIAEACAPHQVRRRQGEGCAALLRRRLGRGQDGDGRHALKTKGRRRGWRRYFAGKCGGGVASMTSRRPSEWVTEMSNHLLRTSW